MKKRISAVLLILAMAISFTACSNHKAKDTEIINEFLKNVYEVTDTAAYENILKAAGNAEEITALDQIPTSEFDEYKKPYKDLMTESALSMYFAAPNFLDIEEIAYKNKRTFTVKSIESTCEGENNTARNYKYSVVVEKGNPTDEVVLSGEIILTSDKGKSRIGAFQRAVLTELEK